MFFLEGEGGSQLGSGRNSEWPAAVRQENSEKSPTMRSYDFFSDAPSGQNGNRMVWL